MKKCVIIGSGLGGLSTGVILAKNGYEVTILEQSAQIGGCLQCFWRDGVKFETGMHIVGSLDDGQILSNYFNYLEIKDKTELNRLDTDAYDIFLLHGEKFTIPNGRKAFVEYFSKRFPTQRENLERYCDMVEQVSTMTPFHDLQHYREDAFVDGDLFVKSLNEVIDQTITDPLLREALLGNITLYAGEKDKTAFATHAFISDFYNKSTFRIVGGSDRIASALAEVLLAHGGRILTRKKVVRVLVDEKMATGVMTDDEEVFPADVVISDIHPKQLVKIVDEQAFTPAYISRVNSIPDTTSVFSLFLRFKKDRLPYLNSNVFGFCNSTPWTVNGVVDKAWPSGYFYLHHCHEPNPMYATGGVIFAYMDMGALRQWEDTTIGKRGKEYEAFKHEMAERLLDAVEKNFPGLREAVESYYAATPLTYRDYTSTPDGAMYGQIKDVRTGVAGRVSFKTKVPNLLLVGQNINSHGMLGVLVGTITVCQHLLGEEEVMKQMMEANRKSVVVIGGGIGGLVSGALLAKEGYKVTVLEKNAIIGGGLQSFKRNGLSFPTGMHVFGGFQEDGVLRKLFSYLGIMDQLSLSPMDENANDIVMIESDHTEYRFPRGRENYVNYLASMFPKEKDNIKAYIEKLRELSKEEPLLYLRETDNPNYEHTEDFFVTFNDLINKYIQHPKLRALLHYLAPMFSGVDDQTPAFLNALTSMMHIEGTCQFVGGSQQMADLLAKVIEEAGGKVLSNKKVVEIKVEDHKVTEVIAQDGTTYHADNYISAVHPKVLLDIIDQKAFTKAYFNRLRQVEETISCFKVFVEFKENTFPFLNHTSYFVSDYDQYSKMSSVEPKEWPQGLMYITPPPQDGPYARTMVINCMMDYAWVKPWENTTVGHRGAEYEAWKRLQTDKVLDVMEKIYPDFRSCIKHVFASSPLTIRDYYGNKDGSMYGFHRDGNNMMQSQIAVFTKVKNLFLTGQNVNSHGLCGVSMTAIETAEAIVGHNAIVHHINKFVGFEE